MLISTRGRYALRVMIDMAEHDRGTYIPLKEIAARQEISEKYLENILPVLIRHGFLTGLRGKGGGYRLTRPPEEYTVGSVIKLVEGSIAPVACVECQENVSGQCERAAVCRTLPMWKRLQGKLDEFFEGITLADLGQDGGAGADLGLWM